MKRLYITILLFFSVILSMAVAESLHAFEFVPPAGIVSKEKLPLKDLNLIRTQNGMTYLISSDGRYVFQGDMVDVWNGTRIKSVKEFFALSDYISFQHIGIETDKLFTLDQGSGPEDVYIFADPNCSVCHELLAKISDSKLILNRFRIRTIVTPVLTPTSLPKAKRLAAMAQKDPGGALSAFINNTVDTKTNQGTDDIQGINYNLLVAKALSIKNFPCIINPRGRIFIGMPDEIYLFLAKK